MTFLQILNGRMLLMSAQRHIAQASIYYPPDGGKWPDNWPKFYNSSAETSFFLIERLICELEKEFDSKKRRRSQRRQINRQVIT